MSEPPEFLKHTQYEYEYDSFHGFTGHMAEGRDCTTSSELCETNSPECIHAEHCSNKNNYLTKKCLNTYLCFRCLYNLAPILAPLNSELWRRRIQP